jgi:hypothetical protein
MGLFGVDVSNHQASFNFDGWDFAFIKLSQGTGFVDGRFWQHWSAARSAGCLTAAYHYVDGGDVNGQFDLIAGRIGPDIPVILDAEEGTPNIGVVFELQAKLNRAGYHTPFTYIPKWYWAGRLGSPSLAGLAPLWASWYPDYTARPKEQGIAKVPSSAWLPYGGNDVVLMQFTSSPFDQNYYPGSREQLSAQLGAGGSGWGGGAGEEDDMAFSREEIKGMFYEAITDFFRDVSTGVNADSGYAYFRKSLADAHVQLTDDTVDRVSTAVAGKVPAGTGGGATAEEIAQRAADVLADRLAD